MMTPELQNFVSQSKAAGQTNEQITTTLQQQGWSQADINEALGQATGVATAAMSTGMLTKLLLGVAGVAVVGGVAAGAYLLSNKSSDNPSPSNQNIVTDSSNNSSANTNSNSQVPTSADCKYTEPPFVNPYMKVTITDKFESNFPSDFPKYQNAVVGAYITTSPPDDPRKIIQVLTCATNKNVAEVKAFFESSAITNAGWQLDAQSTEISKLALQDMGTVYVFIKSNYSMSVLVESPNTQINPTNWLIVGYKYVTEQ
jgi:hypothetical protein